MKAANDTFFVPLVAKQLSPVHKDTILGLLMETSINDVPRFGLFLTYLPTSHLVLFGKSCSFYDVPFCLTYPLPQFFFDVVIFARKRTITWTDSFRLNSKFLNHRYKIKYLYLYQNECTWRIFLHVVNWRRAEPTEFGYNFRFFFISSGKNRTSHLAQPTTLLCPIFVPSCLTYLPT